jgi:hypothetical protein
MIVCHSISVSQLSNQETDESLASATFFVCLKNMSYIYRKLFKNSRAKSMTLM